MFNLLFVLLFVELFVDIPSFPAPVQLIDYRKDSSFDITNLFISYQNHILIIM